MADTGSTGIPASSYPLPVMYVNHKNKVAVVSAVTIVFMVRVYAAATMFFMVVVYAVATIYPMGNNPPRRKRRCRGRGGGWWA